MRACAHDRRGGGRARGHTGGLGCSGREPSRRLRDDSGTFVRPGRVPKERRMTATTPSVHELVWRRMALGKSARDAAPRSAYAKWRPAADRPDPLAGVEGESATRVPELVPIRYGRMLASPFTFFRGGAALMAADLGPMPRSGLTVQLCGDAHLSNFGAFASPERDLVFDINDFDETAPGPFEWDVARLAASFAVAGRDRGIGGAARKDVVRTSVRAYREAMHEFAAMRDLDLWYAKMDAAAVVERWGSKMSAKDAKAVKRNADKGRAKDSMRAFSKLTHVVDGDVRIVSTPPLIVPLRELFEDPDDGEAAVADMDKRLKVYRATLSLERRHLLDNYRVADVARKVVGVGSVGTRAWIILLLGRDDRDPLFLQVKEAEASVLEAYSGKSRFTSHGRRVVEGQRLMQGASDIFLGWYSGTGIDGKKRDFYVRQLWDQKTSAEVETMSPARFSAYAEMCGWTLARAHARSGDRIALAAYLGNGDSFDRAMSAFAEAYADQSERDYEALQAAADSGAVLVVTA